MTTPNTPANGGQILTDERIVELYRESFSAMVGRMREAPKHVPDTVLTFARAIEADLRAALAAPAIPTVPSIRDSCDYESFHEDLLRLSEPGLSRKQAKVIRSGIVNTIDTRVRAFAYPEVAQPAAQVAALICEKCGVDRGKDLCPSENWNDCGFISKALATPATVKTAEKKPLTRCAANRDGECVNPECPQLRDNEPHATGRHCPLDTSLEDEQ